MGNTSTHQGLTSYSHNMLRIALTSPYDFACPGGVNEHVWHLAQHLRRRGHSVDIIAPCSDEASSKYRGLIKVNTKIFSIPFSGAVANITLSPAVLQQVKQILQAHQYDIIHIHEPMAPFLSLAVLYYSRALNVGTFHQYRTTHPIYECFRPLIPYFINRLSGRIAVSQAAHEFAQRYFPYDDYRIIPNGIDLTPYQMPSVIPWDEYLNDGKLNILFIGRLEHRKGFRYLLRAFRQVKKVIPEARLLVAGGFSRQDCLTYVRYVRHFRIGDVKFIGLISHTDKYRWYKTAHVFCAPSTGYESFGLVLAEAMSAGTAVIASDIAGYRDVIEDGVTGLLVPPTNEKELAKAIIHLLRDATRRQQLSQAAQQAVRQYDWARVTLKIEDYYKELLAHHINFE